MLTSATEEIRRRGGGEEVRSHPSLRPSALGAGNDCFAKSLDGTLGWIWSFS